jgi:hypothetical protein
MIDEAQRRRFLTFVGHRPQNLLGPASMTHASGAAVM